MRLDVVVAHYKENLDWLRDLKHDLIGNVFVYTKSDLECDLSLSEKTCHSYLTNVGRESHTYIWHCVNRWDELKSSDFIFFVQGSPHGMQARNILDWINIISKENLDYTHNFRMSNPYEFLSSGRCHNWAGETTSAGCDVKEWCNKNVRKDIPSVIPIFWNACFGVSTKLILSSPISRYVNLIQNELSTINPECGHYCERLWYYIFNMDASTGQAPSESYEFWGGHDGSRHYGTLRLNKDGTVGLYSHHNETFWSRSDNSITLYDSGKKPTCVLNKMSEREYSGQFLGAGPRAIHRLVKMSHQG
jgi:hypothetical protein